MDIYTLQDFLTLTKGQEYLIAIGAAILFTMLWLYLDSRPRNRKPGSKHRETYRKGNTEEQT